MATQPAKSTAEHKDWPDPQRATGGEENHAEPADGVAVEGPESAPIRVRRQIGEQQPDQPEGDEHPAVGTILAFAWAQIPTTEDRYPGQRDEGYRKGYEGRVGEEGGKPTPAQNGEPEIGNRRQHGEDYQSGRHGRLASQDDHAFYPASFAQWLRSARIK